MKKVPSFSEQLFEAVKNKQLEKVRFLVALGADVKYHDNQFRTCLMFCDDVRIADFLISQGADVNAIGNGGYTPLFYAKDKKVAKFLIEHGANMEAHDCFNTNILMYALRSKQVDKALVLIDSGANIKAIDDNGYSVLRYAVKADLVDVAEIIIDKGGEVNDCGVALRRSLWWNVKSADMAKLLLKNNISVKGRDNLGNSDLVASVYQGDCGVVRELLNAGIDVNERNNDGDTALMIFLSKDKFDTEKCWYNDEARETNKKIVRMLLKSGANVLIKNNKGQSALRLASSDMRKFIIDEIKRGKREPLLFQYMR